MEHIVQIGIGIDDESIKETIRKIRICDAR